MFKPLLLACVLLLFNFSCSIKTNQKDTSMEFPSKITTELLEQSEFVMIRENDIEVKTYPVIIYSTNINALEKINIRIQSKSKNFVTALITPLELKKIYDTNGVIRIETPSLTAIENSN